MSKYYTFFFCSKKWSKNVIKDVIDLIDLLFENLGIDEKCHVEFYYKDDLIAEIKNQKNKGYQLFKKLAHNNSWYDFYLSVQGKNRDFQCHIHCEIEHLQRVPVFIEYLWPESPNMHIDTNGYKGFSISVDSALFESKIGNGQKILEAIKILLSKLECEYAYGFPTQFGILNNIDPAVRNGFPTRILDFKYAIYNKSMENFIYLSDRLIEEVECASNQSISDFITVNGNQLDNQNGKNIGKFWVLNESQATKIGSAFISLCTDNQNMNKTRYLLINQKQYEILLEFKNFKIDFNKIGENPFNYYIADINQNSSLLSEIAIGLGVNKNGGTPPCAIYSGLFEPQQVYHRYVGDFRDYEEYTKLYILKKLNLQNTYIGIIFSSQIAPDLVFNSILDFIDSITTQKCYGEIVIRDSRVQTINNQIVYCLNVDLTRTNQAAINMIMLMLDDLNINKCKIPFVIIGDGAGLLDQPKKLTEMQYR